MTQQLRFLQLPYSQDEQLLAALAPLPWPALLSSGASQHPGRRFSIACADPLQRLEINRLVDQQQLREQLTAQQHPDSESSKPPLDLPFISGWLGYFSYDAGRLFEDLPSLAADDLDLPWVRLGYYRWSLVSDHLHQTTWLSGYFSDELYQQLLAAVNSKPTLNSPQFKLLTPFSSNLSKADYLKRFKQVQAYLLAGDAYQVNLAQRFSAEYQGCLEPVWLKLQQQINAPFAAYLNYGQQQLLCLSPERFLQLTANRQVETKPIKGTRPRGLDAASDQALQQDLLNHPKDRAENLMIVDLLRNDLGRVCTPGSIQTPDLFTLESYSYVHHLVSRITGELAKDKNAFDLLQASFPGGSITGAPKLRAMQIIEELEPCRRSVYCGSIGYLDDRGHADFNIAIRTFIADGKQLHLWGGGGLVADSVAEEEYTETLHKVAKLIRVLQPDFAKCLGI